jgi:hypothetical protein
MSKDDGKIIIIMENATYVLKTNTRFTRDQTGQTLELQEKHMSYTKILFL